MANFLKPKLSTKWAKNESLEVRHMVRFKGTENYNPYFIQVDGSVIFIFSGRIINFRDKLSAISIFPTLELKLLKLTLELNDERREWKDPLQILAIMTKSSRRPNNNQHGWRCILRRKSHWDRLQGSAKDGRRRGLKRTHFHGTKSRK